MGSAQDEQKFFLCRHLRSWLSSKQSGHSAVALDASSGDGMAPSPRPGRKDEIPRDFFEGSKYLYGSGCRLGEVSVISLRNVNWAVGTCVAITALVRSVTFSGGFR